MHYQLIAMSNISEVNMNYFSCNGLCINNLICLSAREAFDLLRYGEIALVDLRNEFETSFRTFDVPQIIYISEAEIMSDPGKLPGTAPLILADIMGICSKRTALFLQSKGFDNIAILADGIIGWVKDNLPVKTVPNNQLWGQCGCQTHQAYIKKPAEFLNSENLSS
jgi:rhodanese-related sulfurtransferase